MATLCILFSGCVEQPSYRLVPARGIVTLDDKPVADVRVSFQSHSGIRAQGVTNSLGEFTLETNGHGEGIPPEVYAVRVLGSNVPSFYSDADIVQFEISPSSSVEPLRIELKSKISAKDAAGMQTAAQ